MSEGPWRCPACQSSNTSRHLDVKDHLGQWRLDRCQSCGHIFLNPPLTDAQLDKVYEGYREAGGGRRFFAPLERIVAIFRNRRVGYVESLAEGGTPRVLDIGCGRALMLRELSKRGWRCAAIERRGFAPKGVDFRVFEGELREAAFDGESFDVVTLWHVFEHLRDPVETLSEIRRILKPGGAVSICVPNAESLEARLFGPSWFPLDLPVHLQHFGTGSLTGLLKRQGFMPIRVSTFSLEQDPFSFIQSTLNLMGFQKNLLFELLRGSSRRFDQVVLGGLLLPIAMVFSLFQASLKRGSTLTVAARKEQAGG